MSEDYLSRLVLGTAQLGMRYGIANTRGKPRLDEAMRIVEAAFASGIRWFDTAQGYGDSEAILGHCFRQLGLEQKVHVVTKLHPSIGEADADQVWKSACESLNRLNLQRLDGFLLHREALLNGLDGAIGKQFLTLKRQGLVSRLGVSCYSTEGAIRAMDYEIVEMLQVPGNVFDRSALRAGVVDKAHEKGCILFVRSVYLQGLALMSPDEIPPAIPLAQDAVRKLSDFCGRHDIDRKSFCIQYALQRFASAKLVVGAEHSAQVIETAALASGKPLSKRLLEAWDQEWPEDIPGLINPALWPQ